MILNARVSPLERAPETISVKFCYHSANTLVGHEYWINFRGIAPISCLDLLLESLPCNLRVPSRVNLLHSCHGKGNLSLGIFNHLEKADKMFNLTNYPTFRLLCVILHC